MSIINHSRNFIFLHVLKTAGRTLAAGDGFGTVPRMMPTPRPDRPACTSW